MKSKKIITIEQGEKIIKKLRKKRKKIVLRHGVFDLLHIGHINHFKSSKLNGDILIVTITPDRFVNKGPNRPAFNQNVRSEAIAALECVDYVAINEWPVATKTIKKIRPHYYCKGQDYKDSTKDLTGKINEEEKAIKFVGGQLKITNDLMHSSSELINKFSDIYSDSQKKYITKIKKKFSFEKIQKLIDNLTKLKVLIIGESIIDQYVFCESLGKSGKEPVLVFRDIKTEKYLGGSLAIARHLSTFCNNIKVLSFLGEAKQEESFIKNNIEKNIKLDFLKKSNSTTIIKRRFVDHIDNKKLLGVYTVDDKSINKLEETKFINKLNKKIKDCDLVIISDYGHGIFTTKVANLISKMKIYRSLNAQINSTNMGLHNIRKYKNIDSLIINASELRHELRDREADLKTLGISLKEQISAKNITITSGKEGAAIINKNNQVVNCPAFGIDIIDKVGTGDAMLALLSICFFNKIDENVSLLLASLAAAQSIKSIGNRAPINKQELLKTLFHLMK